MMCLVHRATVAVLLAMVCACGQAEETREAAATADTTGTTGTAPVAAGVDTGAAAGVAADSAAADSARRAVEAVPVETAVAVSGSISSYLVFNSTVETEAAVEVYPQTTGLVEQVPVEEGDRVAADDVLVQIHDDDLRLAAKEARINLDHLEKGFERTAQMFQRRLVSDQEYENRQYELSQARLRWEQARLSLEHATIRAPFSGVITERLVQVGARVTNGTKLLSMIKLDDMIARVFVPGQYLTAIQVDQPASIISDYLPGREFAGWVKRISPVVDPRSGTFKVTVGVRDRWEFLRPGVFVGVKIITDTHPEAVLVPKQAIVYDGGERFIFVVRGQIAARLPLEAGFEDDVHVEVMAGVAAGDPVIVVGQNGLKDQARVRLVDPDGAAVTAPAPAQG